MGQCSDGALSAPVPVVASPDAPREFLRDPIACLRDAHRAHGNLVALVRGDHDFLFAFGPEYNKELLSNPDLFYSNGFLFPGPRNSAQRRLCHGLFGMNGEQHKRQRRLLLPPFQKKAVEAYRDAMAAVTAQLLDGWQPGEERDVSQEMMELTLRVTSKILFGLDDYALAAEMDRHVDRWLALNTRVIVMGSLSLNCGGDDSYREMLATADALDRLFRGLVERQRGRPPAGDVFSLLLQAHAAGDAGVGDVELIGQAVHFFAAANHTTKDSLTWTLFLLAQHPEVMADLHDELHGTLRGDAPTVEQLARLPLLERVIKESLRLLPPVSYYSRGNVEPAPLGPYSLRKGTTVVLSHYVTHHMPDLYPQPERFLPDRWRSINPSPYAYLPFGAGPRMCVGATFAMQTLKIALAVILQRFRLEVVPDARIDRQVTTTLWPKHGLPMRLHRQDRCFNSTPVCGNIHEMVDLPSAAGRRATVGGPLAA